MPRIKAKLGAGYLGLDKAEPIWETKSWGQREVWKVVTTTPDETLTEMLDPRSVRGTFTQALMFKKRMFSRDAVFFSTEANFGPLNEKGTEVVKAFAKEMEVELPAAFQCHGDVQVVREEDWWQTVTLPASAAEFIRRDAYWTDLLRDDLLAFYDNRKGKADISFKNEADRKAFKAAFNKWAGIVPAKRRAA
ncbi:MAG: hypothetical protein DI537_39475 [Stutzerimonas stutzeri]|nr:MAG: hypothetical protein DI537_39475 [Stutzerimonas stutzeri]